MSISKLRQLEQGLSADIAHEFPRYFRNYQSQRITYSISKRSRDCTNLYADMLSIAQQMQHIVTNLMILNQTDEYRLKQQNQDNELITAIHGVLKTIHSSKTNALQRVKTSNLLGKATVNLDIISFNIIISNLVNNALFYSPPSSIIDLQIISSKGGYPQIILQNNLSAPFQQGN